MAFDVNEFFQSVDIILTQRLADLSYDKTIIATIIDDSDKNQGHYIVSDGTIKFDAYSNDLSYRIDDQVRITILNGDWNQKKFIAGKYSNNELTNAAVTYIPPLGTTMQNNHSTLSKNNNWTLYTNNKTKKKTVWTMKITPDSDYYTLQANGIYNVITLSGDFQTNLGLLKQGNYGLLLELFISTDPNSNDRIRKFITFDSSEMIGNPYSFVIDSRQSKQILVASEGIVTEVILSIYQGQNFEVQNGTLIEIDNLFLDYNNTQIAEFPIHFKNIEIGFGSDLTKVEDNSLQIYTTSSTTYHYNEGVGDKTNDKSMGLVWYNKTENDEYIGFSDGIVELDSDNQIIQYDEIDYLEKNYAEARLIAQKGKSGIPTDELSLTLAANIEESEPFMTQTYEALTTDLSNVLQSMGRQLGGTELQKEVNKLISSYVDENGQSQKALLVQYQDIAKEAVQNLVIYYKSILLYGYNIQNDIAMEDNEKWQSEWDNAVYYTTFEQAINNAFAKVESFISVANNATKNGAELAGYRGIYDSYVPKIKKAIAAIKAISGQIIYQTTFNNSTKTDIAWLKTYKTKIKNSYIPYAETDLSNYDNKYCIYWYRYNEFYDLKFITPLTEEEWNNSETSHADYADYLKECENNNREYQFANFLGNNWERVLIDSNNESIQNFGLPTTIGETSGGKTYFPPSPLENKLLNRRMIPTTPEERYQVVLFYNHEMVKSNVLTFINTEADKIPNEFKVDANDTLNIEHGAYSQDHYQSYTSAFDLVNIADESKSRGLRVSYNGVKVGDEALAGASIYWYVPINATMLTYDRDYLVNNLGFSTDAGPLQLTLTGGANATTYSFSETLPDTTQLVGAMIGTKTIVAQDLVKSTITLNKTLASSAISNQKKSIEGASTKTAFSKNGYVYFYKEIGYSSEEVDATDVDGNVIYKSDGTAAKDTKINLVENDRHFAYKIKPFYEPSAQNNSILVEAHVYGENGQTKVTTGEIFFTFSTFGSNGTKYTLTMVPSSSQIAVLPTSSLSLDLSLRNANNELIALNDSAIGSLEDKPDEINTYQLRIDWYAKNKSSGSIAISDIENSKIKKLDVANGVNGNKYAGIINAKVSYLTEGKSGIDPRVITLNTLYPVAFSASENYYISGPTTIVYNNQGTVSRLSEEPFKLYSRYVDSKNKDENGNIIFNENVEVENQTWKLLYYDNEGTQILDTSDIILNYMPSLNSDNTLMPAPMYYQYGDGTTFYVPVAQCRVGGDIVWTQPIIITQNQYASSTLNDWNGKFEINEANGTILSTMLGAGRKTENNTFEGVLIGDIEAGADFDAHNAEGLGIYGFNDGAQSFYFGINGKAFLGKSNAGRILFDGNDGLIYSGNWLSSFEKNEDGTYKTSPFKALENGHRGLNPGLAGLAIDLQEGHIDAYNFKVTSNNIYLNSNPPDGGYYFRIGNNGGTTPIDAALSDNDNGVPRMTRGYMAFTKEGDLDIRTNSLSITGQLGGVNLLRQTEPKRIIPLQKKHSTTGEIVPATDSSGDPLFDWNINKQTDYNTYENYCQNNNFEPLPEERWSVLPEAAWDSNSQISGSYPIDFTNENTWNGKKYYLAVVGGNYKVSQTISGIKKGESYTISGYVSGLTSAGTLTISFDQNVITPQWSNGKDSVNYTNTTWTQFEHTIKIDSDNTNLTITFEGTNNFSLWHAKFESGAISSAWSPAPSDTEDTITGEQEKYDIYLSQDKIFDKLTTDANGEKMVGIWLLPGEGSASSHSELYINASYMSTGILRSSNWDGTIGKKNTSNKVDKYGNKIYTYEITRHPTKGLYLNLDEGKLWAANFELNAKSGGSGLYLNSNPSNSQDWMFLGNSNSYLQFKGDSTFTLKVKNNFTLETDSIYLSDTPKSSSVTAASGSSSTENLVLKIGSKFGVSSEGTLYATGAEFTGNINSSSGKIGGWSIGAESLSSGSVTLNSTKGSVEGATISGGKVVGTNIFAKTLDIGGYTDNSPGTGNFSVSESGQLNIGKGAFIVDSNGNLTIKDANTFKVTSSGALTATSANIGGWQVTDNSSGFSNGNFAIHPTNGLSFTGTGGALTVNSAGQTTIDKLIVTNSANFTEDCQTTITGKLAINTTINSKYDLTTGGAINIGGVLYTNGTPTYGASSTATTTIVVDTPWSLARAQMTFQNGLLVGWSEKASTNEGSTALYVLSPDTAGTVGYVLTLANRTTKATEWKNVKEIINSDDNNNGKFLKAGNKGVLSWQTLYAPTSRKAADYAWVSTGTTTDPDWKKLGKLAFVDDIKKKFNMTLTGTISSSNHSYYVYDDTEYYWEEGEGNYYWIEAGVVSTQWLENYTGYGIKGSGRYHYDSSDRRYLYSSGSQKSYKTYKKAGNISVKITASQDVTLEPSTTTTSSISVTAAGTATIT